MNRLFYTVACRFSRPEVAASWVAWLRDEHLVEVVEAGAESASLVRMDGDGLCYEARYVFTSRQAFEAYERNHAPRLRAEGLSRFPLSLGLVYERTVGEVEVSI